MPSSKQIFTRAQRILPVLPYNLFVWFLLLVYLLPVAFMVVTALKPTAQLSDRKAPLYPARIKPYDFAGGTYQLYNVPTENGLKQLALINPAPQASEFIDPQNPEAGFITWQGNWRQLTGVYEFHPTWENFTILIDSLPFTKMLGNTLFMILVGEIGILTSSILVAYGFARFKLPGGNFLFYVLIATILIPEKILFIPTYFFYINTLEWRDTLLPILVPLYFGNAVYIFLLRQNFRSIPLELEEAAILDGAGPLRRLFAIVLPQSWPVVTTVSLLHFFYSWNETRLASLYLSSDSTLRPISFGIQNYQSLIRIDNVIQAGTIVVLLIPVLVLLFSQRFFMQGLIITGMEKQK
jgi:multiple sugar transport system permease protein